jgi:hypothetical protein
MKKSVDNKTSGGYSIGMIKNGTGMSNEATTAKGKTMKAKWMVIANGKEYAFETLSGARYFAAEHNTTPVRVNR